MLFLRNFVCPPYKAAGAVDVTELHGSLWLLKSVKHKGFLEEPGKVGVHVHSCVISSSIGTSR